MKHDRKLSKVLVVDASVVVAASETNHPVSASCRKVLEGIRKVCHRVVLSSTLAREWKQASAFSQRWQAAMEARGKVIRDEPGKNVRLRRTIGAVAKNQRAIIQKDLHLLEAALATGRIVISRDEKARCALAANLSDDSDVGKIIWVDPTDNVVEVMAWLRRGAGPERKYRCL